MKSINMATDKTLMQVVQRQQHSQQLVMTATSMSFKLLLISSILAIALATANSWAQQIDLGAAARYSGFFFGNVSNLHKIDGRLAVGGDLSLGQASIGGSLPPVGSIQASLVVGGSIRAFTNGTISSSFHTDSWGVYVNSNAAVAKFVDLRKVAFSPIDFAAERTYLSILSQQLRDTAPTGTVSQVNSDLILTGSNSDIEYFNLSAAQVLNGLKFALQNIKPSAYLILNVASDDQRKVRISIGMHALVNRANRVLFNLADTDVLTMQDTHVEGSVLAPYACVKDGNVQIDGSIIAASWDSKIEIGYKPFEPTH